jgi:hypothetical protein
MPPDLPRLQSELHHFCHRKLSFDDYTIPAASRKVPDLEFGLSCSRKSGDKPPSQRLTPALHRGDSDQPPIQGYAIRLIVPHAQQYAARPSRWLPPVKPWLKLTHQQEAGRTSPPRPDAARSFGIRGPCLPISRAGCGRSSASAMPRWTTFIHEEAHEMPPRVFDAIGLERVVSACFGGAFTKDDELAERTRTQESVRKPCI